MQIRLSTPDDYPAVGELYAALYPDQTITAATLIEADQQRSPEYQMKRWVAVRDQRIVGVGSYFQREWFYHPQTFRISVLVHPDHRKQGIGSALYARIRDGLQPLNPLALIVDTYENFPENIRFLEKRGFEIFIRDRELRLDVAMFDCAVYGDYLGRLQALGIELRSVTELADDPQRNQKLYALDQRLTADAPQAEYAPERSLAEYVDDAITGSRALPDGLMVAVHEDDYIGFTQVILLDEQTLYQLLTGVRREYRRKGIALALKLRSIAHAKANQIKTIITNNDPSNLPMLRLNERLGFRPQPDRLFFRKELRRE
ncbi:MAG: GNAT family N-acetyltransferase [Anaerolineae bacterium]|nr:GNAT family N-acetyltransferase [Anaerolineae bacterium]